MSNEETIKEMHDLKDLICAAVRYNPDFTFSKVNDNSKLYTTADNLVAEFVNLVKLCAKGDIFDINMKKFEIKEKIPVVLVDEYNTKLQVAITERDNAIITYKKSMIDDVKIDNLAKAIAAITLFDDNYAINRNINVLYLKAKIARDAYNLIGIDVVLFSENERSSDKIMKILQKREADCKSLTLSASNAVNDMKSGKVQRDEAADKLSIRLTELINLIPIKKIFQKKDIQHKQRFVHLFEVKSTLKLLPLTVRDSSIQIVNLQLQQRFEHLFEVKSTLELLPLTVRDSSIPIVNLQEFNGIKFYFRKSYGFSAVFLLYKGDKEYLVADDHKLYVLNGSAKLVQGCYMNKLQFWKEKN